MVSSSSPIGPLAWSLSVEIPISAPMPNSPPSVKRVETLWYTHAESTSLRNSAARSASFVTMHSEWWDELALMKSIAAR